MRSLSDLERTELLVLYENAAQNLSELKRHSHHILFSSSALVAFVLINKEALHHLNRGLLICFLILAAVLSVILYWRSRVAFEKHRDRIKRIKDKLSKGFQECYGEGPGPGKYVDGFYLWSGMSYIIGVFTVSFFAF